MYVINPMEKLMKVFWRDVYVSFACESLIIN